MAINNIYQGQDFVGGLPTEKTTVVVAAGAWANTVVPDNVVGGVAVQTFTSASEPSVAVFTSGANRTGAAPAAGAGAWLPALFATDETHINFYNTGSASITIWLNYYPK